MANTIKEYLVKLGFKVDENSLARFGQGLAKTAQGAAEAGSVVAATAATIQTAVVKVARQYEDLFYASQRTFSTVQNLKGFAYGGTQIGIAYDQARSSVEAFAASTRNNPGLKGLLSAFGIKDGDPTKQITQLVDRLKGKFGEGGYFVASRYAQMFGLDETTFRQMWTNIEQLKKSEEDHKERLRAAGVDAGDAAAKFLGFSQSLNTLQDNFSILGTRIALGFLKPAERVVEVTDDIVKAFTRLDKATDGSAGFWGTLGTTAVGAWLGKKLLGRVLGLFGKGAGTAGAAGGTEAAAAAGGAGGAAAKAGSSALGMAGKWLLGPAGWYFGMTSETAGKADDEPLSKEYREKHGRKPSGGGLKVGTGAEVRDFFQRMGWTKEQASGLTANAGRESSFAPDAVGDGGKAYGVFQWHPDRQAAFKKWSGKDIRGSSLEEQLRFAHYELTEGAERFAGSMLKRAGTAVEAGAAVSRYYERPANGAFEAERRGREAEGWMNAPLTAGPNAGGVKITQKNDFHIQSTDPKEAGREVAKAQERANGDLVRNTVGALR